MKKFFVIFACIFLIIIVAGWVGYRTLVASNTAVIKTELSERSKEFLASQHASQSGELKNVSLKGARRGEHDFDSQRVTVGNCYSIVVPFAISDDRQNDPCIYYAILESPRGSMTTSLSTVGFEKLDDAPAVTFRRSKKEQYREETMQIKSKTYLVFSDTQTGVEKSAFGMLGDKFFTVSLSVGGDDGLKMRQLRKILESVQLGVRD